MAVATISNQHALRAIEHGFQKSDIYLTLGPGGLEVISQQPSLALISRLRIIPQAFQELPKQASSIACIGSHLCGLLSALSEPVLDSQTPTLKMEIDDTLYVELDAAGTVTSYRTIKPIEATLTKLPKMPNFDIQPTATEVRPNAVWAFTRLLSGLQTSVRCRVVLEPATTAPQGSISFQPTDSFVDAGVKFPASVSGGAASETLLQPLEEVGNFANPTRGYEIKSLAISVVPDGFMRFSYALPVGLMEYWIPNALG